MTWTKKTSSSSPSNQTTLSKLSDDGTHLLFNGSIVANQSAITNVPSKWTGKNWIAIGDSITAGQNTGANPYQTQIASKITVNVKGNGISGTGYKMDYPAGTGNAIYQRLNTLSSLYTNPDLITIFAGTNDWGQSNGSTLVLGSLGDTDPTVSFYGAVDYTLSNLINMFQGTTIAVFTPIPRNNNWGVMTGNTITLANVADAIINVSGKYSVPVLDLYRKSNIPAYNATFRTNHMSDGLHPDAYGHSIMADKILSFLNAL